jgi:hypothetical protein
MEQQARRQATCHLATPIAPVSDRGVARDRRPRAALIEGQSPSQRQIEYPALAFIQPFG